MIAGRWRLLWLCLLGVMARASYATGDQSATSVDPRLQDYLGTYRYVGGEGEIEALDAAIDEVVSQMSFFVRGIARRRLREPNLPSKTVSISLENEDIGIDRPGQPEVSAPASGKPVTWRHPEEGEVFEVRQGIDEDGVLYQRFKGDRSVSRNDFVLGDGGKRLTIRTRIESDRLPAPLRFEMSYQRVDSSKSL
jgi:hypothetical protein